MTCFLRQTINEARLHAVCPELRTRMFGTKWALFLVLHMIATFDNTIVKYIEILREAKCIKSIRKKTQT